MRTSCDEHMEHLSDCLDEGRTPDAETLAHLANCADCESFHAMWGDSDDSIAPIAAVPSVSEAPSSIVEKVLAAREPKPANRKRTNYPVWAGIAAAIAISLFAIASQFQSGEDDRPVTGRFIETHPVEEEETIELSLKLPRLERSDFEDELAMVSAVGSLKLERSTQRVASVVIGVRDFTTSFSKYLPTS